MLTIENIPTKFREKFTAQVSVQGLFAAFLCCADEALDRYPAWSGVWPSRQDFEESMPILWPKCLRDRNTESPNSILSYLPLPPSISGSWDLVNSGCVKHGYIPKHQNILAEQEKRLQTDFQAAKLVYPDVDLKSYSYYWLIANTRGFYYVRPDMKPPEDRNDAMALCPFADYFNHSDDSVGISSLLSNLLGVLTWFQLFILSVRSLMAKTDTPLRHKGTMVAIQPSIYTPE
jgi:hypothetical protein